MFKKLFFIVTALFALSGVSAQAVLVGMTDTAAYFPALRGVRVAVLANHTAVAEMRCNGAAKESPVHLVDLLYDNGVDVRSIFAPEHGFRGAADAGETVRNSVDLRTGIPILSLYNGNMQRPSDEAMRSFDLLLVDMQDVGVRFYTYYISMIRMMDACADFGCRVIVLDRPNPNGHFVDGPLLDMKHKSGVGWLPIPLLHGLTMGEIALMSVGEGWSKPCCVEVVSCRNYTHSTPYILPIAPSPNLPTQKSIYLYPSICLFEGTVVSVGRGTDKPFEIYGHPAMTDGSFQFTPRPTVGAKHPPYNNQLCVGFDLSILPDSTARMMGLDLEFVIRAYRNLDLGERFFTPMFEKLVGCTYASRMIIEGRSANEIRDVWRPEIAKFRELRRNYLLYEE